MDDRTSSGVDEKYGNLAITYKGRCGELRPISTWHREEENIEIFYILRCLR